MELFRINEHLEHFLSSNISFLPLDQTKLVFCLLISYPISALWLLLPNVPFIKHLFGMGVGVWFAWFTMEWHIFHSFISSLVVYVILSVMDIRKGLAHKIVFVWAMGYIIVSHLYRMYVDYMGWTMDFTGPQMMLTIKLTTFAFDLYDGTKDPQKLNDYQKQMALKKMPSFLEFFAYVYFFGGFLAGPAFNLREYLEFVDMSMFKSAPKGKRPSTFLPGLLAAGIIVGMSYPVSYMRTDAFYEHNFLYKIGYLHFSILLARFPYYFAWTLSEGSCNMSGIGYSGYHDGKVQWERANNCVILGLEFAQNFKGITDSWNIRTDKWLKNYIYFRVPTAKVFFTFLTSAVWHGFYPGYYMSFMVAAIIIEIARIIRRNIRPHFLKSDGVTPKSTKIYYDIVCVISTSVTLNYVMTPFQVLAAGSSWNVWKTTFFYLHIANIIVGVVAKFAIRPPRRPKSQ